MKTILGLIPRVKSPALPVLCLILVSGCASLAGPTTSAERYMACPMESVWGGALEALNQYPVITQDREKGIIKTDWRTVPVQGRPYGLFGREGLGDKERSRLTMTLKPLNDGVIHVQLDERRQHWGFRGGQQIYTWYPVEPSQESLDQIMGTLTTKLEAEGCVFES